jgi:hypothetical protein
MEALIVPGAKMPPFAVRKDFQERYCVDRRHIYDYFHSRGELNSFRAEDELILMAYIGLRVSKEDKHTNLIRGRAAKAAAAAAAASTVATPNVAISTTSSQVGKTVSACLSYPDSIYLQAAAPLVLPQKAVVDRTLHNHTVALKPVRAPKAPRKSSELPKARRTFLAPAIGDTSSRESTLSPISEPTFSLGSTPSLEEDWTSQGSSRPAIPRGKDVPTASQQVSLDRAYLGPQGQVLEFVAPVLENGLDLLLGAGPPSLLDSGFFPLTEGETGTQSDPPSLDQAERAAMYNLIQNSLHPGASPDDSSGLSLYESHMRDWAFFSGRLAMLNPTNSYYRPGRDFMVNPYASEYSLASVHPGSGDLSSELFDLRGWLSEDVTQEEGQTSSMTRHPNPISAPSTSSVHSVYLGRYDSYSEPGQMNIRENLLPSGGQAKMKTSSARG